MRKRALGKPSETENRNVRMVEAPKTDKKRKQNQ